MFSMVMVLPRPVGRKFDDTYGLNSPVSEIFKST
jgi:hypothetical protein